MVEITQARIQRDNSETDSDDNLVQAALRYPAAFSELYRRYVTTVFHYCYSRTGDVLLAEDLTSQVFLDALRSLARYRMGTSFASWLFAIAYRRSVDTYRYPSPPLALDEDTFPASGTDPLVHLLQHEQHQKLDQLVSQLSIQEQELLRLRYAGELTYAEIGKVVGRSEAAIKMAFSRLNQKMKTLWEAQP